MGPCVPFSCRAQECICMLARYTVAERTISACSQGQGKPLDLICMASSPLIARPRPGTSLSLNNPNLMDCDDWSYTVTLFCYLSKPCSYTFVCNFPRPPRKEGAIVNLWNRTQTCWEPWRLFPVTWNCFSLCTQRATKRGKKTWCFCSKSLQSIVVGRQGRHTWKIQ